MKYRTHWHFENGKHKSSDSAVEHSFDEIYEVAKELKGASDVIYTYHPEYRNLGARIAIWGTSSDKVCIDVQYSAVAAVKEVELSELREYFDNYEQLINSPEEYGFAIEE